MLNLAKTPIIYVTRDIERALGLDLSSPGYFIISNYNNFANSAYSSNDNVLLIKEDHILDTFELLKHPKAVEFIIMQIKKTKTHILVFKNTSQIERICHARDWKLLNPSAELANKIENKVSQVKWLGELKKYLPTTELKDCKDVKFDNNPFILQFNHAHTGLGTHLIKTLGQLEELQKTFPNRPVRTVEYITGPTLTSNNVVSKEKILVGNINYQITGLHPFTDNPFATVGNDWELPSRLLSKEQQEQFGQMATDIGNKLREEGWKGLFGIDVVLDQKSGKLYLIEINARQPASTSYESQLQISDNRYQITSFEAHIMGLLDQNLDTFELNKINNGAQVVQRVTNAIPSLPEPKLYKQEDFKYIKYNNTKPETDLLRIQTPYSIMESHGKLNEAGQRLLGFISATAHDNIFSAPRASVFIIEDNKILLMKRRRYGRDYYVIIGGTVEVEQNESLKDAALREGKEETGLKFELEDSEPIYLETSGRDEYYYFVKNISGTASLQGPEREHSVPDNSYELVWVDLKNLKNVNLLPAVLKDILVKKYIDN